MRAILRRWSLLPSRPIRRIGKGPWRAGADIACEATTAPPAICRLWRILGLSVMLVMLLAESTVIAASTDYRVHRGDVLEISVLGSPELHRRVMVDDDGIIHFPLVGELRAAGLSLSQLSQQLHNRLAADHAFHNPDVTVEIAEYRPIYVTDGVAKPGAYSYRPGMTVRDAIALAGGYGRDMPLEGINARDQYDALLIESARLQIDAARLRAELAGRTDIDLKDLQSDGVTRSVLAEFASMEAQQLKTEQDDYNQQTTRLQHLIKETQDQITALTAEEAQIRAELGQQHKSAALVRGLFQRSLVPLPRVEDEQRAVSASETQLLEVRARIAQARKDLENYTGDLQQQADKRKIAVMQQLEEVTGKLATIRVHLKTAGERVRYAAAEKPQGLQDDNGVRNLVIFRNESGEQQRIAAAEDTQLLPGDAVAVIVSGPLLSLAPRPEGPRITQAPDPRPAASASGKRRSRDGTRLGAADRIALTVRFATKAKRDGAVAAPLPAAGRKSPVAVAHRAPVRVPGESVGSLVPPQPRHSVSPDLDAASAIPASAVPEKIAPPVAVPNAGCSSDCAALIKQWRE